MCADTCMIAPNYQLSRMTRMLTDEYGTASNIKSRVNRLSVLSAITSTQHRLKLYNRGRKNKQSTKSILITPIVPNIVPNNGLVLYCGTIVTDEGKEKKVNIDFEPHKPLNKSLYLCDNKFHTEALQELLDSDAKFGFIVMDGNGTLFGTLSGNTRQVVHKFSVDLPKKHGRGGQSAVRFARLREEKRHNYIRKVAELATDFFVTQDRPNVAGLVLAGSADFKNELAQSDLFDARLSSKVIRVVDVSYGGENGFNQAIALAAESLSNVKFVQEKRLIQTYFDEISQDSGKFCYGLNDTLAALEMGAVDRLIVWENLDMMRYVIRRPEHELEEVVHVDRDQEENVLSTNNEAELVDSMPLLEWFTETYKDYGATLDFITNRSQEGSQFVKGFGGIGGLLRYKVTRKRLLPWRSRFIDSMITTRSILSNSHTTTLRMNMKAIEPSFQCLELRVGHHHSCSNDQKSGVFVAQTTA